MTVGWCDCREGYGMTNRAKRGLSGTLIDSVPQWSRLPRADNER
jgi:hypothetical protein